MYKFKEIYFTIQGEGVHAGQPAVFCRFTGCNLWSGREQDRHKAICQFCDTDFIGTDGRNGGKYTEMEVVKVIQDQWPDENSTIWAVFTGGEPMLQLDETLIQACHDNDILVAVETNGTLACSDEIDWLCVSPKANTEIVQKKGDELKLVHPQSGLTPDQFINLDFNYFSLQPMDGPELQKNTLSCIEYCRSNPQWRLSVQLHKILGIP